MDSAAINSEMQALLAHSTWVQALARRLVKDPNLAEDLAQETMLAAIRDGERTHRSAKAWLGTVLRNLVWERVRREDRRGAREMDAARDEAIPSTDELMERMAAHKEVVEVLMTLPASYREVLLRRYFEGESPGDIATSLDVPQSTVRTRLSRGTAMMRERLDANHGGDGKAWMAMLTPLTAPRLRDVEVGTATVTSTAFPVAAIVAASAVILAIGAWSWIAFTSSEASDPLQVDLQAPMKLAAEADLGEQPNTPSSNRVPTSVRTQNSIASTAAARKSQAPAKGALSGLVVNLAGEGLAGVMMRFEHYGGKANDGVARKGFGDSLTLSNANGVFELQGAKTNGWVVAERSDLVTVLAGTPSMNGVRSSLLVVTAPKLTFAGRVLGVDGAPMSGVSLAIRFPKDWESNLGLSLESSAPVPFEAQTDEAGHFEFEKAPALRDSILMVRREGYEPLEVELPTYADISMEIELARIDSGSVAIRGEVRGPSGEAIADAKVTDGRNLTVSDELGQFQLDCGEDIPEQMMALKRGYQLGALSLSEVGANGSWPEFSTIDLSGKPLEIHGKLTDSKGRGLQGVRVWVSKPTLFWRPMGSGDEGAAREKGTTYVGVVPLGNRSFPILAEGALGDVDPARESPWPYVVTEADGSFVLRGLSDREYVLDLLDPQTLMRMQTKSIAAGSREVELPWKPEAMRKSLAGRVVSNRGNGLPGQKVGVYVSVFEISDGDQAFYSEQRSSGTVTTDPDGKFILRNMPIGGAVFVRSLDLPATSLAIVEEGESEEELILTVNPLARLSVSLNEAGWATSCVVRDEENEIVSLTVAQGPRRFDVDEVKLVGGSSGVFYAPLDAARLELRFEGEVLREVELDLTPGIVNQLQF